MKELATECIRCTNANCKSHLSDITAFYNDIIQCLCKAAEECIPSRKVGHHNALAGWNDVVKDKHKESRQAFLLWCANGKPRQGQIYDMMRQSRTQFKYAVRICRRCIWKRI